MRLQLKTPIHLTLLALALAACAAPLATPATPPVPTPPDQNDPMTASVNGWLWHDACAPVEGQPATPDGCVTGGDGEVHADGILQDGERPIGDVRVSLGRGACPSSDLVATAVTRADRAYTFGGLSAGTYCVGIDPAEEANRAILASGQWTSPTVTQGAASVTVALAPGESKFDVNFAWDYAEGAGPGGADLPAGPRLVVQTSGGSVQLVTRDGAAATILPSANTALGPAGYDNRSATDGPIVYVRTADPNTPYAALDTAGGRLLPLAFIETPSTPLAVRPSAVAWGDYLIADGFSSQLFLAAPDGSGRSVALDSTSEPPAQFVPFRWGQAGLYFTREPVGLGGMIPFRGAANLWIHQPADGSVTEVVPNAVTGDQLCLDELSPDERLVAHHCAPGRITLLDWHSNEGSTIAVPAELSAEPVVGGVRFSPSGRRVAYGVADLDGPNGTQGHVAVSDGLSGESKVIATSEPGTYFNVFGWLDDDTLLLQVHPTGPGVPYTYWVVNADGVGESWIGDGTLLAVLGG